MSLESLDWSDWAWGLYGTLWLFLSIFGLHRGVLVSLHAALWRRKYEQPDVPAELPRVLIQLPMYNERYVGPRVIRAIAALDYPRDLLEIQVLDDSTDDTPLIVAPVIDELALAGFKITHLRRPTRVGYKAGALEHGMRFSAAPFIAIFDADFVPGADFLKKTIGHFSDPKIGMVQTRWEHLNREYSLLTRAQAILLDGHFVVESTARFRAGLLFNFNGTAGIWRRDTIVAGGGWEHDTVTEDLDLSLRAQLRGWKFIYRTDYTTPAELPVESRDFKTQQARWAKGATQVCRKMLGRIWFSRLPIKCKIEAAFYLLSNLCYPFMIAMALMLGPMNWLRGGVSWNRPLWLDLPILLATTFSMVAFYYWSQAVIGRGGWRTVLLMPTVLWLGIGMSINNGLAALEGLFRRGGEFIRTPKYHVTDSARTNAEPFRRTYTQNRQTIVPVFEAFMAIYMLLIVLTCIIKNQWFALPFVILFAAGYTYIACLSLFAGTAEPTAQPDLTPAP